MQRVAFSELSMRGLAPSLVDPDGSAARNIAAVATELCKTEGSNRFKAA